MAESQQERSSHYMLSGQPSSAALIPTDLGAILDVQKQAIWFVELTIPVKRHTTGYWLSYLLSQIICAQMQFDLNIDTNDIKILAK